MADVIAKIIGLNSDFVSKKTIITLECESNIEFLEKVVLLKGVEVDLSITKHRNKRSNDANSYYYALSTKVANEINISHTEYHNRILAELGVIYGDKPEFSLQPDTDWWLKQLEGTDHYKPIDYTEDRKGGMYRGFVKLKPTRMFNTKEMSALIDYVVQDAKAIGVETLPPEEIERLKAEWKSQNMNA